MAGANEYQVHFPNLVLTEFLASLLQLPYICPRCRRRWQHTASSCSSPQLPGLSSQILAIALIVIMTVTLISALTLMVTLAAEKSRHTASQLMRHQPSSTARPPSPPNHITSIHRSASQCHCHHVDWYSQQLRGHYPMETTSNQ